MSPYSLNKLHEDIERCCSGFGINRKTIYFQREEERVLIAVLFKRDHAKDTEVVHRIDFWAVEGVTLGQLAEVMADALNDEWEESKATGRD